MSCTISPLAITSELELPPEDVIFGASEAMALVRHQVETAARANVPVLLGGQSGTGKEVLAKLIHCRSRLRRGAFVKVNCPAIPGTLLESELFGYERGAFTGAYAAKPGRVETAEDGTLFLDEIAELEPPLQAKMLQLLQDGRFCRIGGHQERQVEVRVVCATNHDLAQDVEAGLFRRDLFYRINVLSITLPPLSERREDIPELVRYLTEKYSAKYERPVPPLNSRVFRMLEVRPWQGNIRELENLAKRYVILGTEEAFAIPPSNGHGSGPLGATGAPAQTRPPRAGDSEESLKSIVRHAVKDLERSIILRTLEANRWNRRLAARALRISYAALLYKMREAGVPPMRGARVERIPQQFDLPPTANRNE
ncbi:MAG TPA: sigma 54-interacting transcriptional regulator [Patescibacteria group bacterium]|nr:sigma 54-interacting transcriptional regulator [Patescibacteria group bacterium]